jgi:hypothetical protein
MSPPRPSRRAALAAALLAAGAAAAFLVVRARRPFLEVEGSVYRLERGDRAYTFDAAWRTEVLWKRAERGRWVRVEPPDPAEREASRALLLEQLRLPGLEAIPAAGEEQRRLLEGLGYL